MQTVRSFEGFLEDVEKDIAKFINQGYQIEHMQMVPDQNTHHVLVLAVFRKEESRCMKIDM